jgi:DNA topoisomerase-1
MQQAILDRTGVNIEVGDAIFRATGQTVKFPGFLKVYVEDLDEEDLEKEKKEGGNKEKLLPVMAEGDSLTQEKIDPEQHFTKPPARYTEASLIKALEAEGIGRPSTYAPTISTIIDRGYVEKEGKALKPFDIAGTVTDFLVQNFDNIVDLKFTANMEQKLDKVAEGEDKWVQVIDDFYKPFIKTIEDKDESLKKGEPIEGSECELCKSGLIEKYGRRGKFIACSTYPECKYTQKTQEEIDNEAKIKAEVGEIDPCEKCGSEMAIKSGRFGNFFGCVGYPECKNLRPLLKKTGHKCPDCKKGNVIEKKSKRGKVFFGCHKYPDCEFAAWDLKQFEEGGAEDKKEDEAEKK